jgi:hypothetical protein
MTLFHITGTEDIRSCSPVIVGPTEKHVLSKDIQEYCSRSSEAFRVTAESSMDVEITTQLISGAQAMTFTFLDHFGNETFVEVTKKPSTIAFPTSNLNILTTETASNALITAKGAVLTTSLLFISLERLFSRWLSGYCSA